MKKKLLLVLAVGMLAITSCKKEGCIEADAVNYDTEAKKDNGTCTYEGNVVIWYGESTATNLVNDGATSLTYTVDGSIVGSSAANVFFTAEPDCGANGSITITKDLGVAKNKSYDYSVEDQTGHVYWSGTANFTANTCLALELTF